MPSPFYFIYFFFAKCGSSCRRQLNHLRSRSIFYSFIFSLYSCYGVGYPARIFAKSAKWALESNNEIKYEYKKAWVISTMENIKDRGYLRGVCLWGQLRRVGYLWTGSSPSLIKVTTKVVLSASFYVHTQRTTNYHCKFQTGHCLFMSVDVCQIAILAAT